MILVNMGEREYRAHPALSSTGARRLLKSPARFKWDLDHPTHSDAFDLGSAVHSKVLGTGYEVVVVDESSWRSKAAREAREEARAEGRVALLVADALIVDAMAESVLAHPAAREIFEIPGGAAEQSVFATDPETGVEVKARFDWLGPVCADLKTTAGEASPSEFARDAAKYHYEVQQVWYQQALRWSEGESRPFRFIVVEKKPPYLVGVIELDRDFIEEAGKPRAKAALRIFKACSEADSWPGYPTDVQLASPPLWLVAETEERFGLEEMVV